MTPYEISILLQYYTEPSGPYYIEEGAFPIGGAWKPGSIHYIKGASPSAGVWNLLSNTGLMERVDFRWRLTEKGRMYVEQGLCKVPLPVNEWRIPWEEAKDE